MEALGWVGDKLDEIGGSAVGRVEGVFVDAESGDPDWLLVRMGRFGHHTAMPFTHAAGGVGHVWAPTTATWSARRRASTRASH